MKKYKVNMEIWIKGLPQAPGSIVHMTEKQAKYLGHALSLVDFVAEAPKAVAVDADKPAEPLGVAVAEATLDDDASY